jgi:hypothetical protein
VRKGVYTLLKLHVIFLQFCELTVDEGNSFGNYVESLMGFMIENRNLVPEWDAERSPCFCVLTKLSPLLFARRKICRNLLSITNLRLKSRFNIPCSSVCEYQ